MLVSPSGEFIFMFAFNPPTVDEIAPDVFRFCLFAPEINLQFNYFLVRDDEPLLFTTGYRGSFELLREAVARVVEPARIRWVGFSHFESDECGALNLWLDEAPRAEPVCSFVSAMVNVNDFASRPPRGMMDGDVLETGNHRFRFCSTAQFPHGWDAGLLFEETAGTLFCSDLFHQIGDVEPLTEADLSERVRTAMSGMQAGPLANYIPYTPRTEAILARLADLEPRTLAIMHGSSFAGDGAGALRGLAGTMREVLGTSS
jgi:flavorubredoxin